MKRKPTLYNSDFEYNILQVSARSDKMGNVFFYVEFENNDGSKNYVRFSSMLSVVDFIKSNF